MSPHHRFHTHFTYDVVVDAPFYAISVDKVAVLPDRV